MHPLGLFKKGPSSYIFILFNCPLHPTGPSSLRGRTNGVMVQSSWDDDSKACGLTVSVRMSSTAQTSDRLSGSHYGAWHVSFFDWILSQIEALLHLPCTSSINTKVYLSRFFIFNWNILSKRNRHPCQRPPRSICFIRRWHIYSVQLLHPSSTHILRSIATSVIDARPSFIHKNW